MKAIETRYKGYRFRSRLEARWAVFFDACGYTWEYEPEGFDLGDGVYYLPDFKIYGKDDNGDYNVFWFEVKPSDRDMSDAELQKIKEFGNACWEEQVCSDVLGGEKHTCVGYGDFILLDGPPDAGRDYWGAIQTDGFGERWIIEPLYRGRPSFWQSYDEYEKLKGPIEWLGLSPHEKARAARFEHGERG